MSFPDELRVYIRDYAPKRRLSFLAVANPFDVYGQAGRQRLGFHQPGYNWNPLTREDIDGWDRNWFLLADEGLDPIIVDLSRGDTQIQKAWHSEGDWDFFPTRSGSSCYGLPLPLTSSARSKICASRARGGWPRSSPSGRSRRS